MGSMLFNVIYWLFGFLRMGTSGMTSQALGRRDLAEVLRLLVRSLSIGVGIGVLFFVLQKWLIGCGLWAMSPEADVVELARRYCYVCIWGAPAVLGLYGFTGWFIGMQNTRIPMMVSLMQNVVNIIASLLLVFVGGMTVEGVALGTVIAQWWGFLMACLFYRICYRRLSKYDYCRHLFAAEPLKQFFRSIRISFSAPLSGGGQPLLYGGRFQGEYHCAGCEYAADDALYHLLLFYGWFCLCGRGVERQVLWSSKHGSIPRGG